MFVYFSNYRGSVNLLTDFLDRLYEEGKISERVYNILDAINITFANFLTWLWGLTQFQFVSISKQDLWNLDSRFSKIIYKGLVKYKKDNTMSIPLVDNEDVSQDLFIENLEEDADNDLLQERWLFVFDQIIEAFELLNRDAVLYKESEEAVIQKGLYLFGKYYRNLWI